MRQVFLKITVKAKGDQERLIELIVNFLMKLPFVEKVTHHTTLFGKITNLDLEEKRKVEKIIEKAKEKTFSLDK